MKYNLVYKLLSVDTNIDHIYYFPYAHSLDTLIDGESKHCVRFLVKKDIQKPAFLNQKFDYFWATRDAKMLYYEHPLVHFIKAKMLVDLSNNTYSIEVNEHYYRIVRFKFENVWPPGQHLTNLTTLKLLQNDILVFHCGSFSNKKTKEGYLIFGPSDIGKSHVVFAALAMGYQYHSEDLTILDKNFIYTTPLISAQSDRLPNKNLFLRYDNFINKLSGLNIIFPRFNNMSSFRNFFSEVDIRNKSRINKIFILEKGSGGISKLDKSEALRKVLILNRLELTYYKNQLLRTYTYFNKSLSIEDIRNREKELIRQIINQADCYQINCNTPDHYLSFIIR